MKNTEIVMVYTTVQNAKENILDTLFACEMLLKEL